MLRTPQVTNVNRTINCKATGHSFRFTLLLISYAIGICFFSELCCAQANQDVSKLLVKSKTNQSPHSLLKDHGIATLRIRPVSGGAYVVDAVRSETLSSELLENLRKDPRIEYVVSNSNVSPIISSSKVRQIPNDPLKIVQWQFGSSNVRPSAINLFQAWQVSHGSRQTIVAVVDTGVLYEHPDLVGRILPGYDFITSGLIANDGDGRDSDASDAGSAVDTTFSEQMQALGITCPLSESTWHGTAITSIIAANSHDGYGMVGVNRYAQVLPVRVLGRCEGSRSDFLDAIRWAAGVEDPYLPPNPNPARIINVSLVIQDRCSEADQNAVNDAISAGAIIVAGSGNNQRNLDQNPMSPATCHGVLTVAAVASDGRLTQYSNYGSSIDLAAPGGDDLNHMQFPVISASNRSTNNILSTNNHRVYSGTSIAAPMASGVLSLMLSINPTLSNEELFYLITGSTRPYTTGSGCDTGLCGSGMLDANLAVRNTLSYSDYNSVNTDVSTASLHNDSQSHEEFMNTGMISYRTILGTILIILFCPRQRFKRQTIDQVELLTICSN